MSKPFRFGSRELDTGSAPRRTRRTFPAIERVDPPDQPVVDEAPALVQDVPAEASEAAEAVVRTYPIPDVLLPTGDQLTGAAAQDELYAVYEQALAAIEAGKYTLVKIAKDLDDDVQPATPHEEILNWMLYHTLCTIGRHALYRQALKYALKPKGVKFAANRYGLIDIIYFISPETAKTRGT